MSRLVLIRGVPGSGKSTIAQDLILKGFVHVEADMFFMWNGQYVFDPTRLKAAHEWCFRTTMKHVEAGHDVVVSNTFVATWEMDNYCTALTAMTNRPHLVVYHTMRQFNTVHGVTTDKVADMRRRFIPPSDMMEYIRTQYPLLRPDSITFV